MAQLTDQQIARHVIDAGFVGDDRAVGVAIVLAESSGRTDARGDVGLMTDKWGPSIGLFQIRSLHVEKGTGGTRDELANLDPFTNARHARTIFLEAGGWRPWSTFLHDTYLQFLDRGRAAVSGTSGDAVVVTTDGDVHIVRAGETLSGIAAAHGRTMQQLAERRFESPSA